ncbi:MAG: NAD(P)H-hydrate dehydratase [Xanthomonadaceae bacterium]|nr:NAD(P)H-hydrate dehydratase [Xanthomonadaceae bacterium]
MNKFSIDQRNLSVLYDTAGARALDREATALLNGDAYVLMQRAGLVGWQTLSGRYPAAGCITVVCGTGNNGGDGYVLARRALEARRRVRVVHLPDNGPRTELAQRACTEYLAAGGSVELFPTAFDDDDVIVDALFGIGLTRAPDAALSELIMAINASACPVFSLDVPSGIDADRGIAPGAAVRADCTLQFIGRHKGLYTGEALDHSRIVLLNSLEVPENVFSRVRPAALLLEPEYLKAGLGIRRRNSHKGDSGRVLCVGGDHGSGGAIALCAEAALRTGAGLVGVATQGAHVAAILARCPEIMVFGVEQDGDIDAKLKQADVLAVGPGLGQSLWARHLYRQALASARPLVLDADGLNLLAVAPHALTDTILTPHPGEAARLLHSDIGTVQQDRFAAADALVERYRTVVVLKGAGSIVTAPGQLPCVIAAGNPGMAIGGMGDLLTGIIASLRAQGIPAFASACMGALLHATAGDEAVVEGGERGLLPSDLLPWLRRLVNQGSDR